MDANEIKMVIFDMDGLMLDTERCYYNGVKEMCEKKQIKVDMSIYRAVIGTSEAIDMEKFNKSTYPNDALEKMICQYVDNRRKELCEEGVAIKKGLRELLNILNKRNILRQLRHLLKANSRKNYWSGLKKKRVFCYCQCNDDKKRKTGSGYFPPGM